jgi:hypothetical protein
MDKFLYGWCLGASLRTVPIQTAAAAWALDQTAMMVLCSNDTLALSPGSGDIGTAVSATGNRRVVCVYHDNVQSYPDVSILAYMLSVNYRIQDSTVTAKFKVLPGIETVQLTETQWATLQSKGYNTYTAIGNNARTYRDGTTDDPTGGWYMDTVINLDNFVEDLSVNVFNVFLRNKKIPYTRAGQMLLVDARSAERFAGENETLDPVAGHIPGARNHPFAGNGDSQGRFLPARELQRAWEQTLHGRPASAAVAMCGSGVTACHNLLALEAAGLPGARLYAGSWSEWIRDPARPVARGSQESR